MKNFNPRPPCGGRLKDNIRVQRGVIFQSTSPVWRTTYVISSGDSLHLKFQSTSPVWRTTILSAPVFVDVRISIHVPRVEDDPVGHRLVFVAIDFNPRPPCGGRRGQYDIKSTSKGISIHVPRVEDDLTVRPRSRAGYHFNPRPPCGGRPMCRAPLDSPP